MPHNSKVLPDGYVWFVSSSVNTKAPLCSLTVCCSDIFSVFDSSSVHMGQAGGSAGQPALLLLKQPHSVTTEPYRGDIDYRRQRPLQGELPCCDNTPMV